VLLTCGIKVPEVCSCKVLALCELLLFLFALVLNALDDFLGIFPDAWVASIGAFDHVDSILEKRPRMWPTTAVTESQGMEWMSMGARVSNRNRMLYNLNPLNRRPGHTHTHTYAAEP
jgi:hypothetical protein